MKHIQYSETCVHNMIRYIKNTEKDFLEHPLKYIYQVGDGSDEKDGIYEIFEIYLEFLLLRKKNTKLINIVMENNEIILEQLFRKKEEKDDLEYFEYCTPSKSKNDQLFRYIYENWKEDAMNACFRMPVYRGGMTGSYKRYNDEICPFLHSYKIASIFSDFLCMKFYNGQTIYEYVYHRGLFVNRLKYKTRNEPKYCFVLHFRPNEEVFKDYTYQEDIIIQILKKYKNVRFQINGENI